MEKQTIIKLHKNFEEYAHKKDGVEFWYARELQNLLGYDEWRNFGGVIEKAKIACEKAKQKISDHFVGVNKMVDLAGKFAGGRRCKKVGKKIEIGRQEITKVDKEIKVNLYK